MNSPSPSALFTEDHHRCDALWAELESAGESKDRALELWRAFDLAMRRHFAMEEEVLFPAIEQATGMHGPGPTMVMRNEHAQMRAMLDQMAEAASAGDIGSLLDHGDTLLMLIQQHNLKEEGILYRLADDALASAWAEIQPRLASYG
jgi:hemerythrin-like domain-containing protein